MKKAKKYINVPISKDGKLVQIEVISLKTSFNELENDKFYVCDNSEDDNYVHCVYDCEYILINKTGDKAIISNFTLEDDKAEFSYSNDNILYTAMSQNSIKDMSMKEILDYNISEYCKYYDNEPCHDKSFKIGAADKLPSEAVYELIAKLHDRTNLGFESE